MGMYTCHCGVTEHTQTLSPHVCKTPAPKKVDSITQVKEILRKHKQILADDQFLVGHALNSSLKKMFVELEAVLGVLPPPED